MIPKGIFTGATFIVDDRLPEGWLVVHGANRIWSATNGRVTAWGHVDEDGHAVLEGRKDWREEEE